MKRICPILILTALLLGACNSRNEQAARAVCKKVSACYKSIGSVKNMPAVNAESADQNNEFDILNSASIIEKPTQILTW
jgi:hypothetical protein